MNVGDYVRTENGIDKVVGYRREPEYENGHVVWFKKSDSGCRFTDKDLPKSSPNIIDLIEENDIVNHSRVVCIGVSTDLSGIHKYLVLENGSNCANGNIKSIVTKEQFKSMEYKLGDE